jgi:hypothetical protein
MPFGKSRTLSGLVWQVQSIYIKPGLNLQYLPGFLNKVELVDAKGIDPQQTLYCRPSKMCQSLGQVGGDRELDTVAID